MQKSMFFSLIPHTYHFSTIHTLTYADDLTTAETVDPDGIQRSTDRVMTISKGSKKDGN